MTLSPRPIFCEFQKDKIDHIITKQSAIMLMSLSGSNSKFRAPLQEYIEGNYDCMVLNMKNRIFERSFFLLGLITINIDTLINKIITKVKEMCLLLSNIEF